MDKVWFGNEAIVVEAHFLANGKVQPTALTWRGRLRTVSGLGRQWDAEDGRHVLVTTLDGSHFELCLAGVGNGWRVLRAWERPYLT